MDGEVLKESQVSSSTPINRVKVSTNTALYSLLGPFGELRRRREPILFGWSPSDLPKPPDWGEWLHATGYWFLERPEGWKPPRRLTEFLDSGPPPVFVGFGSTNNIDPGRVTDMVLRALERTGQRGILVTGWGGISDSDLPDSVFRVEEVPHDWLLERVEAAVHHGRVTARWRPHRRGALLRGPTLLG